MGETGVDLACCPVTMVLARAETTADVDLATEVDDDDPADCCRVRVEVVLELLLLLLAGGKLAAAAAAARVAALRGEELRPLFEDFTSG